MVSTDEGTDRCMFVLSPNPAPPWPDIRLFFIVLATPSLLVASGFAWLGFWPILPFAGLELLGLAAALYVTAKRSEQREVVRISKDKIEIERGRRHPQRCGARRGGGGAVRVAARLAGRPWPTAAVVACAVRVARVYVQYTVHSMQYVAV